MDADGTVTEAVALIVANFLGLGLGFGSITNSGSTGFGCTGLMIGRGVGLANMRPPDETGLFTGVMVACACAVIPPNTATAMFSASVCPTACATNSPSVAVAVVWLLIIAVACAETP